MSDSDPRQSHTDRNTRLPVPLSSYQGWGSGFGSRFGARWIHICSILVNQILDPDPQLEKCWIRIRTKSMQIRNPASYSNIYDTSPSVVDPDPDANRDGSASFCRIRKNGFYALGNMIWVVHPGSWSVSLLLTHPGSRIQGSKRQHLTNQCCGPGYGSAWICIKLKGRTRIRISINARSWIRICIHIKVISWFQIRINLQMTSLNVWKMSLLENFIFFWAFIWSHLSETRKYGSLLLFLINSKKENYKNYLFSHSLATMIFFYYISSSLRQDSKDPELALEPDLWFVVTALAPGGNLITDPPAPGSGSATLVWS